MEMHHSAVTFAVRHQINLGRDHRGYYFIGHGRDRLISMHPTARSALATMRKHLRRNTR